MAEAWRSTKREYQVAYKGQNLIGREDISQARFLGCNGGYWILGEAQEAKAVWGSDWCRGAITREIWSQKLTMPCPFLDLFHY